MFINSKSQTPFSAEKWLNCLKFVVVSTGNMTEQMGWKEKPL